MSENRSLRSLQLLVYMEPETDEVSAEVTIRQEQGNCTAAIHLTEEWRYLSVTDILGKAELPNQFNDGDNGMVFTVDLGAVELFEADAAVVAAFGGDCCGPTEHQFALSTQSTVPELAITKLDASMVMMRQTLASCAEGFFAAARWRAFAKSLRTATSEDDERMPRYAKVDGADDATEVNFYSVVDFDGIQELANQFPAA